MNRFENDGKDLEMTAWAYVHGELDPDEAEAFEALLGEDQQAREAVADAVCVSDATKASPRATVTHGGTPWRRAAVAALLVGALGSTFWWSQTSEDTDGAVSTEATVDVASDLVSAWVDFGLDDFEDGLDDVTANDSTTEEEPPAWLLAAIEEEGR